LGLNPSGVSKSLSAVTLSSPLFGKFAAKNPDLPLENLLPVMLLLCVYSVCFVYITNFSSLARKDGTLASETVTLAVEAASKLWNAKSMPSKTEQEQLSVGRLCVFLVFLLICLTISAALQPQVIANHVQFLLEEKTAVCF